MGNKIITTGILILAVLLVAGCASTTTNTQNTTNTSAQNPPAENTPPGTIPPVATVGPIKEFNMTATGFLFSPSIITVNKGDRMVLNIQNTDTKEHGFSLATFNIVETLPVGRMTTIRFTADQVGEFNFFCSVFCGSGHGDMRGKIIIN